MLVRSLVQTPLLVNAEHSTELIGMAGQAFIIHPSLKGMSQHKEHNSHWRQSFSAISYMGWMSVALMTTLYFLTG